MSSALTGRTPVPRRMRRVFGNKSLGIINAQRLGKHLPILRVGVIAGPHMTLLYKQRHSGTSAI